MPFITWTCAQRVVNLAIFSTPGEIDLRINSNSECSTVLPSRGEGEVETVKVRAVPLQELLRELQVEQVDLVKVDIEGAEIAMFDGCSDEFISRIPQFTIEFHDFNHLVSRADVVRTVSACKNLGSSA